MGPFSTVETPVAEYHVPSRKDIEGKRILSVVLNTLWLGKALTRAPPARAC